MDTKEKIKRERMDYTRVGVAALIVKGNKVLFGKRKGNHGGGTWAPPGGHVEFNEDPKDTAIREVFEETGLKVTDPQFVTITNDIFKETHKHYITLYFLFKYESGEPKILEPEKCERWEWFEWDKLPEPLFITIKNLKKQKFNPIVIGVHLEAKAKPFELLQLFAHNANRMKRDRMHADSTAMIKSDRES